MAKVLDAIADDAGSCYDFLRELKPGLAAIINGLFLPVTATTSIRKGFEYQNSENPEVCIVPYFYPALALAEFNLISMFAAENPNVLPVLGVTNAASILYEYGKHLYKKTHQKVSC